MNKLCLLAFPILMISLNVLGVTPEQNVTCKQTIASKLSGIISNSWTGIAEKVQNVFRMNSTSERVSELDLLPVVNAYNSFQTDLSKNRWLFKIDDFNHLSEFLDKKLLKTISLDPNHEGLSAQSSMVEVVLWSGGLVVIDKNKENNPVYVLNKKSKYGSNGSRDIVHVDDHVFIIRDFGNDTLKFYSVQNPQEPILIQKEITTDPIRCSENQKQMLIQTKESLVYVDVSDPSKVTKRELKLTFPELEKEFSTKEKQVFKGVKHQWRGYQLKKLISGGSQSNKALLIFQNQISYLDPAEPDGGWYDQGVAIVYLDLKSGDYLFAHNLMAFAVNSVAYDSEFENFRIGFGQWKNQTEEWVDQEISFSNDTH